MKSPVAMIHHGAPGSGARFSEGFFPPFPLSAEMEGRAGGLSDVFYLATAIPRHMVYGERSIQSPCLLVSSGNYAAKLRGTNSGHLLHCGNVISKRN